MTIATQEVPGLTSAEVAERVARGQTNDLPPRSGRTTWDIVKANVFTRINFLLMVLFVIVLSTGSIGNALFGFLIIINSGIGAFQELKAKRTLDNLAVVGEGKPLVRRDGAVAELPRESIVVDDIIEIGPGDQIIVDGEIVEASYLEVDESLLTGESDPLEKAPGDPVMSGSFVVAGVGAFRATRVGHESYAAQLAAEASKFSLVKSELQTAINKILRLVTWLLIPVGVATVWVQWTQNPGETWQQIVLRMSGALVPMVPEGLVLLTSLAFAVGVIRLGQMNVLVQELPAIEGLARVDVVCADKTGTLTENGLKYTDANPVDDTDVDQVREVVAQLSAADPRPNASIQALAHAHEPTQAAWSVNAVAPFTSAKKWSGMSFADHGNWVIGAPDVLAAPGSDIASEADRIGSSGRRVLLLAESDRPVDATDAPGQVSPRALLVLEQKVRPEAAGTLAYFAAQDVAVKVISGDNAKSVGAVTSSLGVTAGEVIDARSLPEDPEAFADTIETAGVFGRVTPQQKRQMVAALQSRGHTVAMTGDGVNDVLAIKDSDLGVAMGSGAPATRSVAQIVLLDDDFATLPHVVAEGRRVIGNIERVANFFLTKTMYSIVLALLVALWQLPFPFVPMHVSFIGWYTIGIPAAILALAPNAERARTGFLKRVLSFSIPAGVVVGVTAFVTYLLNLRLVTDDAGATQASTATVIAVMIAGGWVMITIARPYQLWKIVMIVVLLFAAYLTVFWLPGWYAVGVQAWPWLSGFNPQLDPTNAAMNTTGAWLGASAAVIVEALWWFSGRVTGLHRRVFGSLGER
ncbi:HAD-IC family P-type ATPase [Propionicimonas sp.]|uniref:HAD-IC family P-type ATPase n=1 Tax=Propionicimonas sp. TaxID=1955623 RepID=UPI00180E269A|nr:HAD-IC family P-type ATPase [Propionicimonas sp.]MBU3977195.1 HAD-IC family P-type ATPase [Actinomycetota bacterium]MBA3021121.1 HAD-IC family P-type ATPase [Propionicimonas sp.]MBU3985705.1 HAD-IC family P-type ATPase [Actinomycetota bacterium]MBU4008490.1 HAD-IC family P-type ATPase [Actinomycetota bacterium]MBU4066360.1 HAD-IC family P-type ATPase [Actinomycetota bacterium]